MYTRATSLLALYIRNERRYEHPLFDGPGPIGVGRCYSLERRSRLCSMNSPPQK
jgi:hypothetical protein